MGIQGLTKLLGDNAPGCMKENEIKNYFGRKIAIDASMSLYQFLIAVRPDNANMGLTDASGDVTSHLLGLFHRTIRMIHNGIKPVFVFDGRAPEMKAGELAKRKEKREETEKNIKEAEEKGDAETLSKLTKRTVRVTQKHNDEAKKLLRLMGVPVVESPSEAEAQCAALAAAGLVYATGSEDMDSLTFGTPILLRHLTYSEARKMPIKEIYVKDALAELKLTMDQFIDLCILLGCDYCDSIKGIGPKKSLEFINKYGCIEEIIKHLDPKKYAVPDNFDYVKVRKLFKEPDVLDPSKVELKWTAPDEEALMQFLVTEKGFAEDRVKSGIEKLKQSRKTSVQDRLTSYFGEPVKRKREEDPNSPVKKLKQEVKGKPGKGSPAKGSPAKGQKGSPAKRGKPRK
eukprot:TRINITY_DN8153_c0_g1_i1.p1 TRINITY_DN8153_c0_g1~~TRINITY_DN8153_c0_g1_i1.p1  ORF type:complete len:411 (-),score=116.25 TRINITY_DN8153_c0_g1_i1:45-1244(-)